MNLKILGLRAKMQKVYQKINKTRQNLSLGASHAKNNKINMWLSKNNQSKSKINKKMPDFLLRKS
jgi:hypothetical protein